MMDLLLVLILQGHQNQQVRLPSSTKHEQLPRNPVGVQYQVGAAKAPASGTEYHHCNTS